MIRRASPHGAAGKPHRPVATGVAAIGDTESLPKWQLRADGRVFIETQGETHCWTYARHNLRSGRLRATRVSDGVVFYATVEANKPSPCR